MGARRERKAQNTISHSEMRKTAGGKVSLAFWVGYSYFVLFALGGFAFRLSDIIPHKKNCPEEGGGFLRAKIGFVYLTSY